jgi:hypothetical protein
LTGEFGELVLAFDEQRLATGQYCGHASRSSAREGVEHQRIAGRVQL